MVSAARQSDKAVIRIPVLIAAYSGACLGEIVESHKRDFEETESGLVFHIRLDNRSDGQELKTEFRPRRFPLHSSIVPEVKAYLATIADGPLFPDIAKDRYGKAAHNAGETLRRWIKGLGIVRKGIGFHAFRHSFKTAMRRVIRDEEIRIILKVTLRASRRIMAGIQSPRFGKRSSPFPPIPFAGNWNKSQLGSFIFFQCCDRIPFPYGCRSVA